MPSDNEIFLSLQELIQLPDLDQAAVGEFPTPVFHHGSHKTRAYCSRCRMNWASLWTEDDDNRDESYEFCPICKTDFFLEDPLDGPLYVSKMFDGIVNVITGERYVIPANRVGHYMRERKFDREKWEREKPFKEEHGLYAIDQYQKAFATGGQQAGQAAFSEALKMDFTTWLKEIKGIDRDTI